MGVPGSLFSFLHRAYLGQAISYASASKRFIIRANSAVLPAQLLGITPLSVLYQLPQPAAQEVVARRACNVRL